MWELVIPLIEVGPRQSELQWFPPVIAERTVSMGPYPNREACEYERRFLVENATLGQVRPPGIDARWSYDRPRLVGYCAAIDDHSLARWRLPDPPPVP